MNNDLPTAADLRQRYHYLELPEDGAPSIIPLRQAPAIGGEPARLMQYLRSLDLTIETLDDLYEGIAGLHDEEELSAFRCREGVAVSHASDGWWLIFIDDATDQPMRKEGEETRPASSVLKRNSGSATIKGAR